MGSKKKKGGRKWGDKKTAHFFEKKKWGISKKKKMGAKWGDKKSAHFQKMGTLKKKKWANGGQLESYFFCGCWRWSYWTDKGSKIFLITLTSFCAGGTYLDAPFLMRYIL